MTPQIGLLLALLLVATVVLAREWLPIDLTTLLLVIVLVVTGVLSPAEAFGSFANEIIVILASIFVISGALSKTRLLDRLGKLLVLVAGRSESRLLLALTSLCAAVSAFINNTNTTAVLMPATIAAGNRSGISSSRLLIPLAYASILGGTCTLIGTSTNVAASGMLTRIGLEPIGLFELAKVGLPVTFVGVLYLSLVSYRLLPSREGEDLTEKYQIKDYLAGLIVDPDSELSGKAVSEALPQELGLNLLTILRGERKLFPGASTRLETGDQLIVHGSRDALLAAKENPDLHFEAEVAPDEEAIEGDDIRLAEAIVPSMSVLAGRTLRQLRFRQRFGVAVLALYRRGHRDAADLRELTLRVGDVLLLEGRLPRLHSLQESQDLWLLSELEELPSRTRKGLYVLAALLVAIVLGATGLVPLSVALLAAAVAVVFFGVLTPEQAYGHIQWQLLILIGGMTSFGLAMEKTGAAQFLAERLVAAALPFGVTAVLLALAVLTVLLTQPLSNAAAALVLLPIAVAMSEQLGVNARPLAMIVVLSASLSFLTPFEPASLLVYGPGRYRFADFFRAGIALNVIALVLLLLLVPVFWPLR